MDSVVTNVALTDIIQGEFHSHLESQNDNLDNLTNSIRNLGIMEPLIVRKKENKYEIIIGNRRYNAAKILNLEKIPVIIINATDEEVINMVLTHNIQRRDLTSKEEAMLYEKAIQYPNVNIKELSLKLGIPEERINSKLKAIKKSEKKKNNQIQTNNYTQDQNVPPLAQNNKINNDIINIENLNQNEIRRERLNMNENKFVPNNNMNNGGMPSGEPTFGGRFFPAMDNQNSTAMPGQQPQADPLIDLTGSTNVNQQPEPMPIPNYETTPTTNISPEQSFIENNETSQAPTYNNMEVTNLESSQTSALEEINKNLNINPDPQPENPNMDIPSPVSQPEIPNMNIPTPTSQPEIPNMNIPTPAPQPEIPNINIPPQEPLNIEPPIEINNIPNLSQENQPKDIVPIVNMIKNLVSNIEMLGYNISLSETEEPTKYNISIEVDK